MALAYLRYKGRENGYYLFHADTGTAKYFKYVLGEEIIKLRVHKHEVIKVLSGVKKTSSLFKVNDILHNIKSSFPLKIPEHEITENIKYVQLYSFNDKKNKAPSISKILRIIPIRNHNSEFAGITLTLNSEKTIFEKKESTMGDIKLKNKTLSYQEPPLSKVMFWNAIVGALPNLLKQAAPLLGGLLGNLNGGGSSNNSTQNQQSEDITSKIVEVLKAINDATANTTATQPANPNGEQSATQSLSQLSRSYSMTPEALLGLQPILEKILTPEAIEAVGDQPQKLFLAIKDAVLTTEGSVTNNDSVSKSVSLSNETTSNYSNAKVAPALLAIMPIIEKALDPKTIEALGNQPVKLFKAVGETLLKMDEQEIKHLEAINPGVDSADDISKLLQGMSIPHSIYKEDLIQFNLIKKLNLNIIGTKTVFFKNKNRVLYSKNSRILLPFSIATDTGERLDKIVPRSVVQILIKDAETMKLVFRKTIKLVDIDLSKDIHEAFITEEESQNIPCNTEFKLDISYIWKSNSGENIGVLKNQYIHFIKDVVYDRIGDRIGENIAFNDIKVHRKFWHKIWSGSYSNSPRWEVAFDVQYLMALNTSEDGVSKMETRTLNVSDNINDATEYPSRRRIHSRLKSGYELSFEAINYVLEILNQKPLDATLLQILKRSDAKKAYSLSARHRVELKGREGDTSSLWSYPEFSLRKLMVSRVEQLDDYGQVVSIVPQEHVIALPENIHLIGTKSER